MKMMTNGFEERMSNMDNLTIFINKDEQIEIKGIMRELKDGEYRQARLLKSNLMLMVDDNPELYHQKFMYFKSLDDLAFRRLITNYLYYKQVPGIVMTNITGTYYDSELDEAHLYFRDTLMMDFLFNVKRNIYLTATDGRSSRDENAIFRHVFSKAIFYRKTISTNTAKHPDKWVEYITVDINLQI